MQWWIAETWLEETIWTILSEWFYWVGVEGLFILEGCEDFLKFKRGSGGESLDFEDIFKFWKMDNLSDSS